MLNTKKALTSIGGDVVSNKTVRVIFTNPFILSMMIVLIMLLVIILIYDAGGDRAYIKTALYGYLAVLGITYLSAETADCVSEEKYRSQIVEQVAGMPATLPVAPPPPRVTGQGEAFEKSQAKYEAGGAALPLNPLAGAGAAATRSQVAPILNLSPPNDPVRGTGIALIDSVAY